jgi:hypothetical protein
MRITYTDLTPSFIVPIIPNVNRAFDLKTPKGIIGSALIKEFFVA